MDKIKSLIIIAAVIFSFSVFSNCSSDSSSKSESDPTDELNAVRDVVIELSDIFSLLDTGNREVQESKKQQDVISRNFYPGAEDPLQQIKRDDTVLTENPFDEETGPDEMTAGTYTFTDDDGDFCELIIGTEVSGLYPITLKTYPASSIDIDYTFEKINTSGATWDPVDSEGTVDFTARDPYYVKYFDGRIEDITVVDVQNGVVTDDSLNLVLYDTISDYVSAAGGLDDTDSNDYYSESTFTFAIDNDDNGAADTVAYGDGKRVYWEDKDINGNVVEAFTKEYISLNFNALTSWKNAWDKSLDESYFSEYVASTDTTTTYSVIELSFDRNKTEREAQQLGKAVKVVNGSAITFDAQYLTYRGYKRKGKERGVYGVKVIDLEGSSTAMSGGVTIYQQKKDKPDHPLFTNFPYNDYSTIDTDSFVGLPGVDWTNYFKKSHSWVVASTVDTLETSDESDDTSVYNISSTEVQIFDIEKDDYVTHSVTIDYNKDRKRFTLSILDATGKSIIKIINAVVKKGCLEGEAEVKLKKYDVKMPLKGGGIFKKKDDTQYEELE